MSPLSLDVEMLRLGQVEQGKMGWLGTTLTFQAQETKHHFKPGALHILCGVENGQGLLHPSDLHGFVEPYTEMSPILTRLGDGNCAYSLHHGSVSDLFGN